jgi:hypothetical protein
MSENNTKTGLDILIDFDGTVVTHEFPKVGQDIGAVPVLKELVAAGNRLILFTMRSDIKDPKSDSPMITPKGGKYLTEAVNWFKKNGIPLYGIQTNPTQHTWTTSPKAYGQLMIDDSSLGCPLKFNPEKSDRPYVNWRSIRRLLEERHIL